MFILYAMWEVPVHVGQQLALQEGNAVGWMTTGEVFSHLHSIQTTSEVSHCPVQSIVRVKWLGEEANHLPLSSASVKNVRSCMCCTSSPF
jgi:hypothetical protein